MQDTIQSQILNAILVALRPLARTLLRAGVGHREFNEISKAAFVDVATKDYGLRGRPTNVSRVAVMTGLTRKEVRRIRDKNELGEETVLVRSTPMGNILHRWFTETQYSSSDGKPVILPFDDEEVCFANLVQKYGGDIPPGAMRTELKRIGAIEELADGRLKILRRNVSNLSDHDRLINALAQQIFAQNTTAEHNCSQINKEDLWVQRTVVTQNIRSSDRARVRRITSDRLVEFSDSVDDLFAAYETLYDEESAPNEAGTIGIGLFYFEVGGSEPTVFV